MQPIIAVRNVSKYYAVAKSTRNGLSQQVALSNVASRIDDTGFAALRDITFTVHQGEAMGIIGLNGAGKSTLLRILSGITQPSTGTVKLGRDATPLLTLLAGMDPYMTGRQNIYLHGTLTGYSRQYIDKHLTEIIDFADLGEFIDMPMATYSNGMKMRLAFSTAMIINAGILLIDEVLAVGDVAFQEKALAKMRTFFADGKTIVMASHNIPALQSLCHKIIWLDKGEIREIGSADEVLDKYLQASKPQQHQPIHAASEATIDNITLHNAFGTERRRFQLGESIHIQFDYGGLDASHRHYLQVRIHDYVAGEDVFQWHSLQSNQYQLLPSAATVNLLIEDVRLRARQYQLEFTIYQQLDNERVHVACRETTSFIMFDTDEAPQLLDASPRFLISTGDAVLSSTAKSPADTTSDR